MPAHGELDLKHHEYFMYRYGFAVYSFLLKSLNIPSAFLCLRNCNSSINSPLPYVILTLKAKQY